MAEQLDAEFVWFFRGKRLTMAVYVMPSMVRSFRQPLPTVARVSNTYVNVISIPPKKIEYRCPTILTFYNKEWVTGPVFAILAGSGAGSSNFQGSQLNFRDIMEAAKARNIFIYVLPASAVTDNSQWYGYVRLGYQKWLSIPCPRPQAVYNRIPTRYLERRAQTVLAKQKLKYYEIPIFNPDYFNKATIYDIIRHAGYDNYLPHSSGILTKSILFDMLHKLNGVYLKPAGGSVGHGMILILHQGTGRYVIQTLKNGVCDTESAESFQLLWQIVDRKRLPGSYVVQEAISLISWYGRPCDFRVLLQKHYDTWRVVGKGVRVSGPDTITTHVPNGGYIADTKQVLREVFADGAEEVEQRLDLLTLDSARAIDEYYQGRLGEMSMDVGIDKNGRPWFFEANAKPMKFDEKEIREKSIAGVIDYLQYLGQGRKKTSRE